MNFTSFLESAFQYYTTPSLKNMFSFVKTTHALLKDDQIAKIEKKVADAHLRAAIETAETIQYEKDHYAAAHRILTHLEQAYQIYLDYYDSRPKAPITPYIPMVSVLIDVPLFIRECIGGRHAVGEVIEALCVMIATYHRVLNDSDELVERWLISKRVETAYSKVHFIFYNDESSEDNLMMWLLGEKLVKKHGSFIDRNGGNGGGGGWIDPDDGSHDWVQDL